MSDIECSIKKRCKDIEATSSCKTSSKGTDRGEGEPCKKETKSFCVCAKLEFRINTADCNFSPFYKHCPPDCSTEYCTCVLQHILTSWNYLSPVSLFGHKEREISSCTFMIFTVWSWRSSELSQLKNNLQSVDLDEIAYPVLCAKKWVSSACPRTTSGMISLSIETVQYTMLWWPPVTPHPQYIHILTFLCNIIGSIASNNVPFFQAHALLTNSSHGSYSLQDTPRLQHVLRLVTPDHSPEPTNSYLSIKNIHYWTDWHR